MRSDERRLHPLSFLFELKRHARNLLLPALFVLLTAGFSSWQVFGVPFFVAYGVVAVLRYLSFRYRYDEDEIVIRTGFIFRNERHVPYQRIHNIDAVQNLFHRLFGVAEVRVQTAAGNAPEATMKVLPLAALEEMRARIFPARRAEGEAATGAKEAVPDPALLQLSMRDLMVYGLIENRGMLMIAAGLGVIWEFGLFDRISGRLFGPHSAGRGFYRSAARAIFVEGEMTLWKIGVTIAGLLLLVLAIRAVSMAWAAIRFHGFTLARSGNDLRTDYGLFTRVSATIPLDRIQSATVREGPLHRLFARVSVRVETAGGYDSESSRARQAWVAPVVRKEHLARLLAGVLPGIDLSSPCWQPIPPRAFRRIFKESMIVVLAATVPLALLLRWRTLVPLPLLVGWACLHARLSVAHLAYAMTETAVLFKSGWWNRQTTLVRFAKIQTVSLTESPFDRRRAMAGVSVDTAGAASAIHRVRIPYLEREVAARLHSRLFEQAARTAFRW